MYLADKKIGGWFVSFTRCAANSLSDDVVCAPSVPVFKYGLKRFSFWRVTVFFSNF